MGVIVLNHEELFQRKMKQIFLQSFQIPPDAARHNTAESLHLYEHKVNIFTAGT